MDKDECPVDYVVLTHITRHTLQPLIIRVWICCVEEVLFTFMPVLACVFTDLPTAACGLTCLRADRCAHTR